MAVTVSPRLRQEADLHGHGRRQPAPAPGGARRYPVPARSGRRPSADCEHLIRLVFGDAATCCLARSSTARHRTCRPGGQNAAIGSMQQTGTSFDPRLAVPLIPDLLRFAGCAKATDVPSTMCSCSTRLASFWPQLSWGVGASSIRKHASATHAPIACQSRCAPQPRNRPDARAAMCRAFAGG